MMMGAELLFRDAGKTREMIGTSKEGRPEMCRRQTKAQAKRLALLEVSLID